MTAPDTSQYTPAQMAEARGWMSDCQWREDPEDIAAMSDAETIRGVERHYPGGMAELIRMSGINEPEAS